jgi:putative cell wall-binding protein
LTTVVGPVARAGADDQVPAQWPSAAGASPRLTATAHSVRLSGDDRFQTNLAIALALRGRGPYPFASPDRAVGWWGASACPGAVVVVAGDTTADALAATPLSDPTDQSTEPRLRRTSTSNPVLRPVGAFTRVDTVQAPVIVTASTRQGATSLSLTAATAARDAVEAKDGCLGATAAIVVGGTGAVPPSVDDELVALGYEDVFRVAGNDRYETAATIAESLGTAPAANTSCLDADETDGDSRSAFYANSVVEYRSGPQSCTLLSRSVVLADGISGIDALSSGWFTAFFQVPVLLTGPNGSLPPATLDALTTMNIDNLIVVGGSARIPSATVSTATAAASASSVRIAGVDRYETSVRIAETIGGWWPTGDGADAIGAVFCLAGSAGAGNSVVGAPDALGAGPLCAAAAAPASTGTPPVRALPPTAGSVPAVTTGARAKDLVPILLTAPGQPVLSGPTASLLDATFAPSAVWCSSAVAPPMQGCAEPGFAIVIGGAAVVSDFAVVDAARAAAGGTYLADDVSPSLDPGWWTRLDLGPVFAAQAPATDRYCVGRGAASDVRWLGAWADATRTTMRAALDLMLSGLYGHDGDSVARSPGTNAPACVAFTGGPSTTVTGVSLSGHVAAVTTIDTDPGAVVALDGRINQTGGVLLEGDPITSTTDGASSHVRFTAAPSSPTTVTARNDAAAVSAASIDVTITRGAGGSPTTFTGRVTLTTSKGAVAATISGEVILDGNVWRLRGKAVSGGWNFSSGTGGFIADLDTAGTVTPDDDTATWQLDGLVT